jgi:hypothetical protein
MKVSYGCIKVLGGSIRLCVPKAIIITNSWRKPGEIKSTRLAHYCHNLRRNGAKSANSNLPFERFHNAMHRSA